jgi:hypothetical protein
LSEVAVASAAATFPVPAVATTAAAATVAAAATTSSAATTATTAAATTAATTLTAATTTALATHPRDVLGLWSLLTLAHLELYPFTLIQRLEPRSLNRREVNEAILAAAIRGDEPEPLLGIEPLNSSGRAHDVPRGLEIVPFAIQGTFAVASCPTLPDRRTRVGNSHCMTSAHAPGPPQKISLRSPRIRGFPPIASRPRVL